MLIDSTVNAAILSIAFCLVVLLATVAGTLLGAVLQRMLRVRENFLLAVGRQVVVYILLILMSNWAAHVISSFAIEQWSTIGLVEK